MPDSNKKFTGKEFYHQFLKVLGESDVTEINADDTGMDEYHLRKHILFALRQVTGVDENGE